MIEFYNFCPRILSLKESVSISVILINIFEMQITIILKKMNKESLRKNGWYKTKKFKPARILKKSRPIA